MKNPEKVEIFPDDIFLVSYPKTGNTWLRFLIASYLADQQTDFVKSSEIIPDIHYNPLQIASLQKPRLIKSHHPYTDQYKRVVYIARDGRDVAVSYYFYAMKCRMIDKATPFADFVARFNEGTIDQFTIWSEHVNAWHDRSEADFLLIRYEDMKANCANELIRVLQFANLPIDQQRVLRAVKASEFSQMQQIEQSQSHSFELFRESDPDIAFVRSGQPGDWVNFFSDDLLTRFIEVQGQALERLGYLPPRITAVVKTAKANSASAHAEAQLKLEQLAIECQQLNQQLQLSQSQIEQLQIAVQQHEIQAQIRQKRQKRLKMQIKRLQAQIVAMESSKFWQLRRLWFSLKATLGFAEGATQPQPKPEPLSKILPVFGLLPIAKFKRRELSQSLSRKI
jgi:Sulfotransferase domain